MNIKHLKNITARIHCGSNIIHRLGNWNRSYTLLEKLYGELIMCIIKTFGIRLPSTYSIYLVITKVMSVVTLKLF